MVILRATSILGGQKEDKGMMCSITRVAILIVIFLLKPEKPFFSFQTVRLDWYELDAYSGSVLFVSSVMTLTLNAQNPNKVGLRYSPSRLNVYYEGVPIGVIRVLGFFQPAHSNNVSVRTRVLFHSVNVTQLVAGASLQDWSRKDIIQMNILGDIRVQLLVFDMNFLKIKVCSMASHFAKIYEALHIFIVEKCYTNSLFYTLKCLLFNMAVTKRE
jgi:hypothetical protein